MRAELEKLFKGSMRGRTMYVVPFSMGPLDSEISHVGVQLTDSAYVAVSMRIMTRMGAKALEALGADGEFVPCVHTVGMPLADGAEDVPWPCNETKYIVHYPEPRDLVVRIGLWRQRSARQEVLRAADRLGDGPRRGLAGRAHADPEADLARGRRQVRRRRLPLRLWQDQPGDADPDAARLEGRDRRRRHRLDEFGDDGRLYAVNPEAGFFGVAPNTSYKTNPNAMATIERNTIFTNCAETDGDVWWRA